MRAVLLAALLVCVSGCATEDRLPEPVPVESTSKNPFLKLKRDPKVSKEQAIEIACGAMEKKKVTTDPATVTAILAVHEGHPLWHVAYGEMISGGWQVVVNAHSGAVLFAEVLGPK